MCGFAGIVAWDPKYRVDRAVLERMSARIAHRGPDGQGIWESPGGENAPYIGLVHRRLAIIDLDERANQPFTDGRGRWIVFNGEIYNYRELRKELEALLPDYVWKTQSDTEVLLAAYAAWGYECVTHLNGMFAFAIWDDAKRELFLARDRMGQKPLYVAETTGYTAFASEISALLQMPSVRYALDERQLEHYLRLGYTARYGSIYRQVLQVTPSCYQFRSPGMYESANVQYAWGQLGRRSSVGDKEAVRRTRSMVEEAVRRQLVADVPIGCFLSGGVDSSVIAAAMTRAVSSGQQVHTFSIGFDDPQYDETEHAAKVAHHLKTVHRQFVVKPNAAADLPKLAAIFGEPFGDSSALPTHYLSRETRQFVKVALSGDGGDELFAGYDRYRAIRYAQFGRWIPRPIRSAISRPLAAVMAGGHPKSRIARMGRFFQSFGLDAGEQYSRFVALFDPKTLEELLGRRLPEDPISQWFNQHVKVSNSVRTARYIDLESYLPCDILTKVDRSSMLHALEVRSPFMDHELVEFAATLTTKQLLKGGPKRMLREAFADLLPAWVFKRKKMGFAVPIGEWFRGDLRAMLRDHLFAADAFGRSHFNMKAVERLVDEHERETVDHSQRLYALLMLELWWKTQK